MVRSSALYSTWHPNVTWRILSWHFIDFFCGLGILIVHPRQSKQFLNLLPKSSASEPLPWSAHAILESITSNVASLSTLLGSTGPVLSLPLFGAGVFGTWGTWTLASPTTAVPCVLYIEVPCSYLFHLFSSEFAFSCPGLWISVVALALICLLKSKRSFNIMMCSKGSRLTTFVSAGPAESTTFLPWTLRSCILLKWVHRCCSQTKTETRHSGILWLSCSGEYWIDPWAWNCKPLKVNWDLTMSCCFHIPAAKKHIFSAAWVAQPEVQCLQSHQKLNALPCAAALPLPRPLYIYIDIYIYIICIIYIYYIYIYILIYVINILPNDCQETSAGVPS